MLASKVTVNYICELYVCISLTHTHTHTHIHACMHTHTPTHTYTIWKYQTISIPPAIPFIRGSTAFQFRVIISINLKCHILASIWRHIFMTLIFIL